MQYEQEAQIRGRTRKRVLRTTEATDFGAPRLVGSATLHDQLTEQLRAHIVEGDMPDGQHLVEANLCRKFGVSRTPLREAFKVLAGEGLIEIQPNRGARITAMSGEEMAELFAVLAELEALAAGLAARHVTDAQLAQLEQMHRQMVARRGGNDLHGYFQFNDRIHRAIVHLSRNRVLIGTYGRLLGPVRRARYHALLIAGRWETSMAEHEALMEALRGRASARASRIWRKHALATGDIIAAALAQRRGELKKA